MLKSWRIALILLVQILALGGILVDRAMILATGREIVLKSEPVDPRDLFRGDFVILGYPAGRFDVADVKGDNDFAEHTNAYVILSKQGEEWVPSAIYRTRPDAQTLRPDDAVIKASVESSYSTAPDSDASKCPEGCQMLSLSYGVESYFVPEGSGATLEAERNERRLDVVVAVRADGRAAIKALKLDGKIVSREGFL